MGDTRLQRHVHTRQRDLRRALAIELRRVLAIERVSLRALGREIGVDPSHLSHVLAGDSAISHDALVAVATGLGYDVSVRLFESTGPRVRDRIQVRMIEALLDALDPRWIPRLELAVHRPVRGVIDVVLQDREAPVCVAGEAHSALASVEGQIRWAGQKAEALDSARGWPWTGDLVAPRVDRLLVLRSCTANHALVAELAATFRTAYPADTGDAVAALRGAAAWPGSAIAWVHLDGAQTRLMDEAPRSVAAALRRRGV
jgi:transcriptional regulator with XRE-family HTH domain